MARGLTGPAVYDKMEFELDYYKICTSEMSEFPGPILSPDQEKRNYERKLELMNTEDKHVSALVLMAWIDRVSKDRGIPYHTVEMEDFEEWYAKGFRAEPGEFRNIPESEKDRISDLACGCVFRK